MIISFLAPLAISESIKIFPEKVKSFEKLELSLILGVNLLRFEIPESMSSHAHCPSTQLSIS